MLSLLLIAALASISTATYVLSPPNIHYESTESIVASLLASNHLGAPLPPNSLGSTPGWYFGDVPGSADDLPWLKDVDLCSVLAQSPGSIRCPHVAEKPKKTYSRRSAVPADPAATPASQSQSPVARYRIIFSGLTGAIQGSGYLTYGLVDTVSDCETMCDNVSGCVFFNSYHDVNGKNGSPLLTCSLYNTPHTADEATNTGGQTQPDGSVNYITDSDGMELNTS
ncbi:uncharacterized protein C8R40DRAFT_1166502 [Lentinula edodes]|uniref:uncharacterized protein n=1 Tax=Lentinula edodes TaxID=5353 RepID=UPI001E8D9357|nr:uncharacterized protein C8R40DRAFT_1166502 [Lentinula edodes]KAH7879258.1 hypothetical protein C8R40DRAFT_1166502 [Lentinula edodes]